MNVEQQGHPFKAPAILIADPTDGLLKTSDLYGPVSVDISIWDGARPGYQVQLVLNDRLIGLPYELTENEKPGDIVKLPLTPDLLAADGSYKLQFEAMNNVNQVSQSSPAIMIRVDREAPGAALLAPLIVPAFTFGDRLKALLPGYAGMEPGDVIRTVCNGVDGPSHTVQADELTLRPVEINFERELLQGLAAEHASIEYFVTDRAGNSSVMAPSVLVSLQV